MQKNDNDKAEFSREEIKDQLRWGDITLIAKIAKVGRSTVERYFNHKNDNPSVKKASETLISTRDKKMSERLNKLL